MTIQVVVTTYVPADHDNREPHPRAEYLHRSIDHLTRYIKSPEPVKFILANDGPEDQWHAWWVGKDLLEYRHFDYIVTGGERVGIGGSLNRALTEVGDDDIWMYTTDDWVLTEKYDLTQATRLIRELNYDYVRLGPPHPNIACTTRFQQGLGWWLDLAPECGGFAFATRPFLASKRFYNVVGPFKEQRDAYECEKHYAREVQSVGYLLNMAEVVNGSLEGPWLHIGEVEVGDKFP